MMKEKDALDYIIRNKQIRTVFQPIISLKDGKILGHEALSRIIGESQIKNPDELFSVAGKYNRLWELELLCRTKALEAAHKFVGSSYCKKLFINVNPHIIDDETFKKGFTKVLLEQYGIAPHNVIFEITEKNIISDMGSFQATINHYKSQNYKIAIDDAGAGYSGLNLISDISPDYIKLDMNLIRNVNKDSLKYALIRGMVEFSKVSNVFLIAEGIETLEELNILVNLGVQFGQGYFIQRPDAQLREISPKILKILEKIDFRRNHTWQNTISNLYIKNLCSFIGTIPPDKMVPEVYDFFRNDPDLFGLSVIKDDIPVGIITKEKLTFQLSGHYGFALNQNKPVSKLMDRKFLSVDYKTPVSIVSEMAMSRPNDKLYDFIVVTEEGKYAGVVTIKDLLKKSTEIEVSAAKHQNPLTGLPGNLIIEQKLVQCLEYSDRYSVTYFDIDNFKAYNDVYGFEKGDLIIKLLADILRDHVPQGQFIGHIGGDDFIVILDHNIMDYSFKDTIKQFENEVLAFYNQTDVQNKFIITNNRRGEIERFPLITLTAVTVSSETQVFKDALELSKVLACLKKVAKKEKNTRVDYKSGLKNS